MHVLNVRQVCNGCNVMQVCKYVCIYLYVNVYVYICKQMIYSSIHNPSIVFGFTGIKYIKSVFLILTTDQELIAGYSNHCSHCYSLVHHLMLFKQHT